MAEQGNKVRTAMAYSQGFEQYPLQQSKVQFKLLVFPVLTRGISFQFVKETIPKQNEKESFNAEALGYEPSMDIPLKAIVGLERFGVSY